MDKDEDKKSEDKLEDLEDLNLEQDSSKRDESSDSDDKKDSDSKSESSSEESSKDEPKKSTDTTPPPSSTVVTQDSPADALSRDPEDLAQEQSLNAPAPTTKPKKKRLTKIKAFLRKLNVYFLFFLLIVIVAGAITVVMYLNSQQEPEDPDVAVQEISQEALQQLANNDVSIGDTSQTLTIQGSAVIEGQTLMRGNLSVAGNIQSGGSIQGSSLNIPGESNLGGQVQINNLQVATDLAIQGTTTVRDLSASGSASFGGSVQANQLTVTNLILSGNSTLEVPNHISFTGPSPSRTMNGGVLGGGGSTSINGSDSAGTVNINTGGGTSAGCMTRITFNQPYSKQPYVIVSPVGAGVGNMNYYVERDQSGFSICTSNAPAANQSFAFDYFVMN